MSHIRRCSKYCKSKFKNIQATSLGIQKLTGSINWERASTNRDAILQNLNKAQQPIKRLGSQSRFTWNIRKTLKHIFQVLKSYSFEIWEVLCLLLFQASTGDHSYSISIDGIKLQPKFQISCSPSFKYQVYWRAKWELEVHVGANPYQRSLRISKLGLIIIVKFTMN